MQGLDFLKREKSQRHREVTVTIGKVAREAGVPVETVRYYERIGLIPQPPRRESGYRQYAADTVLRIRFIKNAQGMGFTLKEIADLLDLRAQSDHVCDKVRIRAERKIEEIERKIQAMTRLKEILGSYVRECGSSEDACVILQCMEEGRLEEPLDKE